MGNNEANGIHFRILPWMQCSRINFDIVLCAHFIFIAYKETNLDNTLRFDSDIQPAIVCVCVSVFESKDLRTIFSFFILHFLCVVVYIYRV